ncbi:MAG: hypothetical protein M3Y86_10400, partial [Verrucomicrobiota bacterium]|nr:hypothetical protein [Verrucomicrobiota bacterium]
YPRELFCALALWAKGDIAAAQPYFEQSRLVSEDSIRKGGGSRVRTALALALAGLGRKSDAIQHGTLATEQRSIAMDAVAGPPIAASLARVYLMVGEHEPAIALIEKVAAVPFGLSLSRLKRDPCYDPVREHPRFQQLITELEARAAAP